MKVYAPGKLILSGEHAVVHGNPALAMAVNRYVTATVTHEHMPQILLDLSDIAHNSRLSFEMLRLVKDRIKRKYHRFIRGEYSIRQVLQKPFELAQFAISVLAETLNLSLPHGVKIHVKSDIPIGCGMGSSAATILSVMHAISTYMEITISPETLFQLALEAENMQHGHSSGLDLRIAMNGGCLYINGKDIQLRDVPATPMFLVNTGTPASTTGQCVETVATHFESMQLKDDFAVITNLMDHSLQQQSWSGMQEAVRENHRLLITIGVVPEKVQKFVSQIEMMGGSAKTCGAGSVTGDNAGAVLVMMEDEKALLALTQEYGYSVLPISGESRGVHVV